MKIIKVVAAVIKSLNDKGQTIILSTQRGYGEFKDSWEFREEKSRMEKHHKRH